MPERSQGLADRFHAANQLLHVCTNIMLSSAYNDVVREPVPDDMAALLDCMSDKEKPS